MATTVRQSLLGKLDKNKPLAVIGGGISGLLAAYYAKKNGWQVKLIEKSNRVGGLIESHQTGFGVAETAAHSFLMTKIFEDLLKDIGVDVVPVNPLHKARFIFRDGKMSKMPVGAKDMMILFWNGLTKRMDFVTTPDLASWGNRHLGPAVTQFILEPALQGIYAGDPSRMSVQAVLPSLKSAHGKTLVEYIIGQALKRRMDREERPLVRGMFSIRGGTENLAMALSSAIGPASILKATEVANLNELRGAGFQTLICTPAPVAGQLLSGLTNFPRSLTNQLMAVEYLPLIAATVFVRREKLKKFHEGVGVLVAPGEPLRTKGVLFNSSSFSGRVIEDGVESLTVILGGAKDLSILKSTDDEIRQLIQAELGTILGLEGDWEEVFLKRWLHALPHYTQELNQLWLDLERALPEGVAVFGNYTGTISVRGLVDSAAKSFAIS